MLSLYITEAVALDDGFEKLEKIWRSVGIRMESTCIMLVLRRPHIATLLAGLRLTVKTL